MTKFTSIGVAALAAALLGATVEAQASPYIVTLEEVGSNVVATGSGQLDLTGWGLQNSGSGLEPGWLWPVNGWIFTGAGGSVDTYYQIPISGPAAFGSGNTADASSGSGDNVGLDHIGFLMVPVGYVTDTALLDSSTYSGKTLVSLGVTPGTYVWTWGLRPDESFTLEIVASLSQTPLPAALPLFATGLGALGLLGWRRKRKAQVAA